MFKLRGASSSCGCAWPLRSSSCIVEWKENLLIRLWAHNRWSTLEAEPCHPCTLSKEGHAEGTKVNPTSNLESRSAKVSRMTLGLSFWVASLRLVILRRCSKKKMLIEPCPLEYHWYMTLDLLRLTAATCDLSMGGCDDRLNWTYTDSDFTLQGITIYHTDLIQDRKNL